MLLTENDTEPKVKRARDKDYGVSEREGDEDRLSDLPDCVLIHLMTFMTTKDSVRTTVLSTRWKDLWKCVPSLILSTSDFQFRSVTLFNKFVPKFLSLRDSSVPLLSLDFCHNGRVPPQLLRRVVRYAALHNIEQLKLSVNCDIDLPPCIFSCQTLTSLDLAIYRSFWLPHVLFPKSLNLTALTSLRVQNFEFCANEDKLVEPFSSCVNLKTLFIDDCVTSNQQILCISNATLVNLIIHTPYVDNHDDGYKIVLSTPNLCSFTFAGIIAQQLEASNLCYLKEVDIDVDPYAAKHHYASILIKWFMLQAFANVRSLTVSSSTLQVLSAIPDLLNTESPCLDKLKSMIVKVKEPLFLYQKQSKAAKSKKALKPLSPVPDRAVDYLIRNSPFANVTKLNCQRHLFL